MTSVNQAPGPVRLLRRGMVTERTQRLWRALRTRSRRLWHALVSIFFCAELTLIILLVTVPLYSEQNRANVSRQIHVGKPYYKGQWAQSEFDGFGWHKIRYAIDFFSSIFLVCAFHTMIRCDLIFHWQAAHPLPTCTNDRL